MSIKPETIALGALAAALAGVLLSFPDPSFTRLTSRATFVGYVGYRRYSLGQASGKASDTANKASDPNENPLQGRDKSDKPSPSSEENRFIAPSELEAYGARVMSIIRQHFDALEACPVTCANPGQPGARQPGECAQLFSPSAPMEGVSMDALLEEIKTKVLPNACHWQHPKFFAYYPASTSSPAILSEAIIGPAARLSPRPFNCLFVVVWRLAVRSFCSLHPPLTFPCQQCLGSCAPRTAAPLRLLSITI